MRHNKWSRGFTFIELIIVFTVMTILGTVGIASLANYNHEQQVVTTATDLKTLLQYGRSLSMSQIMPVTCNANGATLLGYEVDFCAGGASGQPSACTNSDDYEVNALCSAPINYVHVSSKKYASQISINSTYRSYFFPVISAGADHTGIVTVSAYGVTRTITVTNSGVIQ